MSAGTLNEGAVVAEATRSWNSLPVLCALLAVLFVSIALARIVATYHVFNHTVDEGAHLASGIQWFQGAYTYDPKHTPVARVMIALLPYLDGLRGFGNESYWQEGVQILSTGGRYWHNLTLARIGVLPFFVLAMAVIYWWSWRLFGLATAVAAVGIFSLQPTVLAHSAIATTDIPLTAVFLLALTAFTRWLAFPNWQRAAVFGLATGLSIATKLSTLAFLPATMVALVPLYLATRRRKADANGSIGGGLTLRSVTRSVAVGMLCAALVVWAAYRFSHAPINQFSKAPERIAARLFGPASQTARDVHFLASTVQMPMPELYSGLRDLRDTNRTGTPVYMFGHVKQGGYWYYYPVGIALKTPIGVLVLALLGAVSLAAEWLRARADWEKLVPLVAFLAIVAVAMPTRLDIGVRHVMPVFAFLSVLAAVGAVRLWTWRPRMLVAARVRAPWLAGAGPAFVVILLTWLGVSSVRAHPDYLAYFNEMGGAHPAEIMVDSNLDWGQDLSRLAGYLRTQHAQHLSIAYGQAFDAAALGLPESQLIKCGETASGWIAIGEDRARGHPDCYRWIAGQPVRAYVGRSLRVYYVAKPAGAAG